MYKRILVPLDNSSTDNAIVEHVVPLAKLTSAEVVFVHVADGFVARNQDALNLRDSEEIVEDRIYLEKRCSDFKGQGISARSILAKGDPTKEILRTLDQEQCDLIAMSTHGHGAILDLILGSVSSAVRHRTKVPVLLVRGERA